MLRALLVSLFTFHFSFFLSAQVYPFTENFSGLTSGQVPPGWTGDMKVLTYHGTNDDKGLSGDMGSANNVDSCISPLIGPLTNETEVYFWYRIVDKFIYPSTPSELLPGDEVRVSFITSDSVEHTLLVIDSSNHINNLDFRKFEIAATTFVGENVQLKFNCNWANTKNYYVDIDSIKVRDHLLPSSIHDVAQDELRVWPTVADEYLQVAGSKLQFDEHAPAVYVYDINGSVLYEGAFTFHFSLFTSSFANGLYFLRIGHLTRKFIVQH